MVLGGQVAQKLAEKEAREAGLEGKDAFAELKALSRSESLHRNDPREDLERLYRRAPASLCVPVRLCSSLRGLNLHQAAWPACKGTCQVRWLASSVTSTCDTRLRVREEAAADPAWHDIIALKRLWALQGCGGGHPRRGQGGALGGDAAAGAAGRRARQAPRLHRLPQVRSQAAGLD